MPLASESNTNLPQLGNVHQHQVVHSLPKNSGTDTLKGVGLFINQSIPDADTAPVGKSPDGLLKNIL